MTPLPSTGSATGNRISVSLDGVPETMLWPLWHRVGLAETGRVPREELLDDPRAADLLARIDYDFVGHFGRPHPAHTIRAKLGDRLIRDFAALHDRPIRVLSLGEGLETQLWRVDDGRMDWVTLDLPEGIALRRRLLPAHPRNRMIAASAFTPEDWISEIGTDLPCFVSAAGLLMYAPDAMTVTRLLTALAAGLPGGQVYFDTIPGWYSRKTRRGLKVTPGYTAPPMPFALTLAGLADFAAGIAGFRVERSWTYADPFPRMMPILAMASRIGVVRRHAAPLLILGSFAPTL